MSLGGQTSTGKARVRCTIVLNNGSQNEPNDKACHLSIAVLADAKMHSRTPLLVEQLQQAAANKTAMSFFCIQGKQTDRSHGEWAATSNFGFSMPERQRSH